MLTSVQSTFSVLGFENLDILVAHLLVSAHRAPSQITNLLNRPKGNSWWDKTRRYIDAATKSVSGPVAGLQVEGHK